MNQDEWICRIPKLIPMQQTFEEAVIEDPRCATFSVVSSFLKNMNKIRKGGKVAITVGSRGIKGIREIVTGTVEAVKKNGCNPFIVPAMGSHGSETPLGKVKILEHLGITETSVGAPISRSNDYVLVGQAKPNLPVYCHAEAFTSDSIILLNRIKPHTDFRGLIESGLIKIACVGLGGELGARCVHSGGLDRMGERIRAAGEAAIKMLPIHLGLAIIEGHSHCPLRIEAILGKDIPLREEALLRVARRFAPKLPVQKMDVLIVAEMGKDISGAGLDTAITGRSPSGKPFEGEDVPDIYRIVVLDLTNASSGNSVGIGLCDVTTRRLCKKTNFRSMYRNVINGKGAPVGRFPMVMESDREAISVGLLTCLREPEEAEIVVIKNTLQLEHFLVTESLVPQCEREGAKVINKPIELSFDLNGSLILPKWIE